MFFGQYPRSLDPKGRLAIPPRFREHLPQGSVVTIGQNGALRLYPPAEWDVVTQNLRLSNTDDPQMRSLIRRLFAEAYEVEFDGQGRVLIPAQLREQAGIEGSAVVTGANNVVEIWSSARWNELRSATEDFTALADAVAEKQRNLNPTT